MTRRRSPQPMSRKLLIGLCGVIACVVLITHLLLAHAVESLTHDTTRGELTRITHTLALDPRFSEARDPSLELHHDLERFAAETDTRLTLIRADGLVLADTAVGYDDIRALEPHDDRPEVLEARSEGTGTSIRHSVTREADTLYVAHALKESADANILRAARLLPDIESDADDIRELLYWIASATLIGALVFSLVMARWLSRPIRTFTEEARQITRGETDALSHRATTTAELVDLAEVVSELLAELERLRRRVREDSPRLTALLEALPTPALIVNPLGQIARANPAAFVQLEVRQSTRDLEQARLSRVSALVSGALEGDAVVAGDVERDEADERWRAHVAPIKRLEEPTGAVILLERIEA